MTIFEDLIPEPLPAGVKVLYGTVTGSSPLRVQVDRDPGPLPVTPTTTVACAVGDRVVMLSHVRADNPDARARAVVIVGVIGAASDVRDVTSEFTRVSGSPARAGEYSAYLTGGKILNLWAYVDGGWAGGTWASTQLFTMTSRLNPKREVYSPFPFHPTVIWEVRATTGVWLASSTGGIASGIYRLHMSWPIT